MNQRIGNSEREAAIAALKTHHAAGRIDGQEYEERALQVRDARNWAQLHHLFVDLPEPKPRPAGTAPSLPPGPTGPPGSAAPVGGEVGPGTEGFEGPIPANEWRGGLVPEPWAWMIMSLTPIAALIAFFTSGNWEWFLAIPIAGILIYGPDDHHNRDRQRRRTRRRLR